jgi:hypothetical protein
MAELAVHYPRAVGLAAQRASWNPLTVSGTALPDNLLLATKLVALAFVLSGQLTDLPEHFLPFLSVLRHVGSPHAFHLALELVFAFGAALLLVNRQVRTMCILLAAVLLLGILSSRAYYHNNRLFTGIFFLLAGLYDPRLGVRLFRYQLVVLYLGAALNKVVQVDWRTGAFVQDWLPHYTSAYLHIARLLPDTLLSALMGWLAIVTEFGLVVLLLIRRLVPLAIFVGIGYHTGLVLITQGSTFGMFWYALMGSYLALLAWPRSQVLVRYRSENPGHRWLAQLLQRFDVEQRFDWHARGSGGLEAHVDEKTYRGSAALVRLLLYSPPVYITFIVIVTVLPRARILIPAVVVPLLAMIAWGVLSPRMAERRWRTA